jgi:4-amino-4-deoxy-L-arabinose transferase-like glycosyltransferase
LTTLVTRRASPGSPAPAALVGLAGTLAIGVLAFVVLHRLRYPYELQWMEGGAVDHVRRVLHGQAIYAPPTRSFASYAYPPLYWWVSAPVAAVVGTGLTALRLVSVASTVATLAILALVVRRETGHWAAGLISAGAYAGAFAATGASYDVARVDPLMLALLLGGMVIAIRTERLSAALAAGLLLALASLTKQTALFAALPLTGWLIWRLP